MAVVFQKDGVWYAEFSVRNPKTGKWDRKRPSTRIKVDGTAGAKKRAKVVADELERVATDPLLRAPADDTPARTLADAADARWEVLAVREAPKGTKQRHRAAWAHLHRLLGRVTACHTLTKQHLVRYAAARKTEGAEPDTYRRELVELRAGLRVLGEPVPSMPELPPPRARDTSATAAEIEQICAVLLPHRARVIRLISQTGLRRNEVYALQLVGPGVGRLVKDLVPHARLKTGERTVPLTPAAEAILKDGPLQRWPMAGRDLRLACKRAGIRHLNFNDLRSGVAMRLLEANVAPARIAALLGHTSLRQIERRYAKLRNLKVTPDDLKALDPAGYRPKG